MPQIPPLDLNKHYKGSHSWLSDRIVYMCEYGSHAYGTATPSSDYDYRGVAVAPMEYYTGILNTFEQAVFDSDKDSVHKIDVQIYDIRVFARHILQNNPSVIECLWMDESSIHMVHPSFLPFLENKHRFLSKRAALAFSGYSIGQFQRMKSHRNWLLNPPTKKPERSDFGLPENPEISKSQLGAANAAIREKTGRWSQDYLSQIPELDHGVRLILMNNFDRIMQELHMNEFFEKEKIAAKQLGMSDNFIDYLKRESLYEKALKEYNQYNDWKKTRNPERAKLEAESGFDRKNAAHLYRLMNMCKEIFSEGIVRVKRSDAEELLAIRNGKYTYEEIEKWVLDMKQTMEMAAMSSVLRNEPDRELANKLTMNAINHWNKRGRQSK